MNSSRLNFPNKCFLLLPVVLIVSLVSACSARIVKETEAKASPPPPKVEQIVPTWLGNPGRNFYGTGPLSEKPLEVVWEFKTGMITGRLHEDLWGGTSWPGQPSVNETRVYFGSA